MPDADKRSQGRGGCKREKHGGGAAGGTLVSGAWLCRTWTVGMDVA